MNDLYGISGAAVPFSFRAVADTPLHRSDSSNTAVLDDRVEISELAVFLSRLAELPDARARKIVSIRNAIQEEVYLTDDKLDTATERLLQELSR